MTAAAYTATKAYRDELARALEVARQSLSVRDFVGFGSAIAQEIARLDLELSKCPLVLFPRTALNSWSSILVQRIQELSKDSSSIRFNSPPDASWTTRPQQLHRVLSLDYISPACAGSGF